MSWCCCCWCCCCFGGSLPSRTLPRPHGGPDDVTHVGGLTHGDSSDVTHAGSPTPSPTSHCCWALWLRHTGVTYDVCTPLLRAVPGSTGFASIGTAIIISMSHYFVTVPSVVALKCLSIFIIKFTIKKHQATYKAISCYTNTSYTLIEILIYVPR